MSKAVYTLTLEGTDLPISEVCQKIASTRWLRLRVVGRRIVFTSQHSTPTVQATVHSIMREHPGQRWWLTVQETVERFLTSEAKAEHQRWRVTLARPVSVREAFEIRHLLYETDGDPVSCAGGSTIMILSGHQPLDSK